MGLEIMHQDWGPLWLTFELAGMTTLILFVLDKVDVGGLNLLQWIERALEPVLGGILHLPSQAAPAFVLGFLRRDYGAAGLYSMQDVLK